MFAFILSRIFQAIPVVLVVALIAFAMFKFVGDPVTIMARNGAVLGRGLSAYASSDAQRIAGHRSDEIEAILGWRGRDEMVHRDDLVLNERFGAKP